MELNTLINEPKTDRGKETFNNIYKSAERLFYEKGYHNTTVNDITEGANVALGTFYIYFKDKMSIYKYVLLRFSHEIRKEIRIATKNCNTRYEQELIGLKTYLNFIKSHKNAYKIIWESLTIDFNLFKEYYETFASHYVKELNQAIQTNELTANIDPISTAYTLMGISNFIGLKYIIFEDQLPSDDVIDNVMNIIKNGLFNLGPTE